MKVKSFLIFYLMILWGCRGVSGEILSQNSIKAILYQVFNAKELGIGKIYYVDGKLIRFPVCFYSHFIVKYPEGQSIQYNLKDFFYPDSDIIFFKNDKDLIPKLSKYTLLKNNVFVDFQNYKELKEWLKKYGSKRLKTYQIPIFTIEEIEMVDDNTLKVKIVNLSQNVFSFTFEKISNQWMLKKLSMRYKFSDVAEEKVVYY